MNNEEINEVQGVSYEIKLPPKMSLAGHGWIQMGPMLVCRSCPYEHSQSIPPNLEFKGLDDKGYPILERFKR